MRSGNVPSLVQSRCNFMFSLCLTSLILHAVPDVVLFQEEAISALEKFPTPASRLALTDILEQDQCFYKVRMQACFCLSKVGVWMCAFEGERENTDPPPAHLAASLTELLQKLQLHPECPTGGDTLFHTMFIQIRHEESS